MIDMKISRDSTDIIHNIHNLMGGPTHYSETGQIVFEHVKIFLHEKDGIKYYKDDIIMYDKFGNVLNDSK